MKLSEKRQNRVLFYTVVIGLIAHGFRLTNRVFCNDSFNYLTTISRSWTTAMGRFLLYLAEEIRGGRELTWLIGIFSIGCIALAAVLITELFDLKEELSLILVSAVMVANPTVAGTFGYMYTADGYFFGMLLSVLAAYLVIKKKGIFGIISGSLCLVVSLALYQAYLSLTMMLLLIMMMLRLLKEEMTAKEQAREVGRYALMGVISVIVYLILLKIARARGGYDVADYMGQQGIGTFSLSAIFSAVVNSYIEFARYLLVRWEWTFYSISNLLIIAVVILQLLRITVRRSLWKKPLRLILVLLYGLLFPIVTHIFLFLSEEVNYITPPMSYSMCAVFLMPLILHRECAEDDGENAAGSRGTIRGYALYLLLALSCVNFIIFANRVYESMYHANGQVEKLLLRIEERMEAAEGYSEDAQVMILGNRYQKPTYPENGPVMFSAVSGLFLSFEGEYVRALNWYLSTDYTTIPGEEKSRIVRTEEFSQMEEWPSANCVKTIDGVIVVYLSDNDLDEYLEEE